MAALSGKVVQHNLVAKCCQQNRELSTTYRLHHCTLSRCDLLPPVGRKLAWNGNSTIQLRPLTRLKRRIVCYNAASSATAIPSVEKNNFLKLQNGSDIRGVAVDGVEGEPLTLTEPVTEAIAAGFAGWLLAKKKHESSKCLRVSIGHDSRISAQKLQLRRKCLALEEPSPCVAHSFAENLSVLFC